MRPSFIVAALLAAALIIGVLQWQGGEDEGGDTAVNGGVDAAEVNVPAPEPVPSPQTSPLPEPVLREPQQAPSMPDPVPAVVLPELAASDEFVLAEIDSWQLPEAWLQRSDLLPRATVVLMNAAQGKIPARQVSFLVPPDAYPALKQGDRYFVDSAGYARYAPYLDILEGINPGDLAAFMRLVDPLLVQALAQLGVRERPAELVADAIVRVERVADLPQGPVELLRPSVMYTYADPALEALPDLDKQLLRMGPQNVMRLRAYLSEFKEDYLIE